MEFRIADTFTDSLAKLTGDEQKSVKTTAFDLQLNPTNPGMQFHRLDKARDKSFWSVRVSRDIRIIVHKTNENLLLCYVDHHDNAYEWAARRKLETHPRTGAAQLVEIRETVREIIVPKYVEVEEPIPAKPLLFTEQSEEELLGYGVPSDWIDDVRTADEDSLFEITPHLPREAAEALLELATGGTPTVIEPVGEDVNPFEHPDAQRRFRLMTNVDELKQALDYPWEKWTVFLHPAQRTLVERKYNGPTRVAGSAGTGKTVVAIHRVVFLAREHENARVLLTTFSSTLAKMLESKIGILAGHEPETLERISVLSITDVARELYASAIGEPQIVTDSELEELLSQASDAGETHRFSQQFIWTEWREIVDAWQLDSWESYRDVPRLGRKTRLGESQRRILWAIFDRVKQELADRKLLTIAGLFASVTDEVRKQEERPYRFAVIDEAQDIGVPELRFLSALGADKPDCLFFAGDLGQRIFQPPFSWKSLGVDIRGRSKTLRINYRTSHQIRLQADRLLPPELSDVDGNTENRRGTVSAFDGPLPEICVFDSQEDEIEQAALWLSARAKEGLRPHEIGIFVRSDAQFDRARQVVNSAKCEAIELEESVETREGCVSIMTMHLAKGLEFRAVLVMACDDEIVPLQERVSAVVDDSDLEEVYNTERHLLYVACTRARDHLMVSGVDPASEFLDDLIDV
jgi:mRNA-degrading endonuclease RelE of RelBE toxin-antitoxin system